MRTRAPQPNPAVAIATRQSDSSSSCSFSSLPFSSSFPVVLCIGLFPSLWISLHRLCMIYCTVVVGSVVIAFLFAFPIQRACNAQPIYITGNSLHRLADWVTGDLAFLHLVWFCEVARCPQLDYGRWRHRAYCSLSSAQLCPSQW